MKRVGFLLKVRQDMIEEYKAHHRAVWPDMLDALSRNGWHNYSLFMREDGLMFGYFETEDSFAVAPGRYVQRGCEQAMAGYDVALF